MHHKYSNDNDTVQLIISWMCDRHQKVSDLRVYKTDLLLAQLLLHIGNLLPQSINLNLQQISL